MSEVKIDSTMPNRISMNVTVGRQSQGATFGEKVNAGLQNGASAVASGASMLGSTIPGAALVSAAVSNVGRLTSGVHGSASSAASYSVTGMVGVGGGLSTTVGPGGMSTLTTGTSTGDVNLNAGMSNNTVGTMNASLQAQTEENAQMLQVQIAMQRENQQFTSVSNILKTKADTVKNSISNIR